MATVALCGDKSGVPAAFELPARSHVRSTLVRAKQEGGCKGGIPVLPQRRKPKILKQESRTNLKGLLLLQNLRLSAASLRLRFDASLEVSNCRRQPQMQSEGLRSPLTPVPKERAF